MPHYDTIIVLPMVSFTDRVIEIVASIPEGRVATYGEIAGYAGNPRGARQVARVLHTSSGSRNLPWHRVVNRHGAISLPPERGGILQRALLESEGVTFGTDGTIDVRRFGATLR